MYQAVFSRRAQKAFLKLAKKDAERIKETIKKLSLEPRVSGTIKLTNAPVAQYRYRVGNWRILFDIDDDGDILEILDIRKRDEKTYHGG